MTVSGQGSFDDWVRAGHDPDKWGVTDEAQEAHDAGLIEAARRREATGETQVTADEEGSSLAAAGQGSPARPRPSQLRPVPPGAFPPDPDDDPDTTPQIPPSRQGPTNPDQPRPLEPPQPPPVFLPDGSARRPVFVPTMGDPDRSYAHMHPMGVEVEAEQRGEQGDELPED
jgi:hypothetical protein